MILKDMEGFVPAYKHDYEDYKDRPMGYETGFAEGTLFVMDLLDELPIIEAKPVVHANWVTVISDDNAFTAPYCSNCHYTIYEDGTKYCANCGAQMDGEKVIYE